MSNISDINWLLGTVTQSSAALIAIVGGLLVSRYVALHAEQEGAGRRVEDLKRRGQEAGEQLKADQKELSQYDVDGVLDSDDVYEEIIAKDFEPTTSEILSATDVDEAGFDAEILQSSLTELCEDLKVAGKTLYPLVPVSTKQLGWLDFKRSNSLLVGSASAWAWMYKQIRDERIEEAEKIADAERRNSSPLGSYGIFSSSRLLGPSINPTAVGINRLMHSQQDLARMEALRRRIDQSAAEVRALEQEQRLAEETHQATRQPAGFSLALQVLSVLAFLGMAIPVSIMGFGVLEIAPWMRATVIALFFVGVFLLLRFLFVYASFLREGGRRRLPRTVFGLLKRG